MSTTTIDGRTIHVDQEGFLTEPAEWDEDMARSLSALLGIELDERHWKILRFLRADHASTGETPTLRRVSTSLQVPMKELFQLFPTKPAKKMAYVAGLPKPRGCV
ncbi:sulfurtransferase TusE [Nocardioides psychrotolerans]|uniref:tRNA 2-thiouridine synthesizing protein E n=1 Tax=Nocardioides psychrotolerans TaxID=1005945 RepID=A0A1I3JYM4_9ACTN|nr:TusE/DsrC/DsvC family sulfur relay protein [Nocardioides psychrotolerans]GEP38361.1 sulfurtransferase TusE [Nocardioides psychrotolerans]SFI65341.1 tRNA 2-thiouridine synthesizing protein E [Nocardioides psychrotolerans]